MIYFWQQTQWQHVEQLISSDRLPHALLLHGNQGLGKLDFAWSLASAVLCQQPAEQQSGHQSCGECPSCQLLAAQTHPDMHYLEPEAPAKSNSKNPVLNIRIDEVRKLCGQLNQTSQMSGYRVALINKAEALTISAANSLLKTLEEPGEKVLIILVSSKTHRLPITIRSRCQRLRFHVPEAAKSLEWLKARPQVQQAQPTLTEDQLKQALNTAFNAPLQALDNLGSIELHQVLSEAMTARVSGKNSLDYAVLLAGFNKVATLEAMMSWSTDLARMLQCGTQTTLVNEVHRDRLQTMSSTVNQQRLFKFYEQLQFNLRHSSIAINEQLLWENLLLSWDNL